MKASEAIDIISNGRHDMDVINEALDMAVDALKMQVPERVIFKEYAGFSGTRFKCPRCNKIVKNYSETYCHKCGQRIVYPIFDHTPYVEGQKQELIIKWPDE